MRVRPFDAPGDQLFQTQWDVSSDDDYDCVYVLGFLGTFSLSEYHVFRIEHRAKQTLVFTSFEPR